MLQMSPNITVETTHLSARLWAFSWILGVKVGSLVGHLVTSGQ